MDSSYSVIVVGAGCAGLSAAVRLAAAGVRVLVLEGRARLGGRATAFVDRETGEPVDNGQHVLVGAYTETLAFLTAIGAREDVRLQPQLSVTMIDRRARRSRLVCPSLPSPLHLLAGVFEWDALTWSDRLAVLRIAAPLRVARRQIERERARARRGEPEPDAADTGPIAASPDETVEQWLTRNGQTPHICELLWDPLALAATNQPPATAAAPPFVRVLAEMFGGDPRAAAVALPRKPLDALYADPARAFVEAHGGTVRTGAAAKVSVVDGAVASVDAAGERWTAPVVISAVPWFAFADLVGGDVAPLADLVRRARTMRSSPIVTINLWFDRPILDEPFVGLPGRSMQWLFDKGIAFNGAASHVATVSSGAADMLQKTNDELVAEAHREIVEALPDARGVKLRRGTVIREPNATFSLAPGQPARPGTATPVKGLFLAGDWIATGLPATIESAVRSGHRAAEAALTYLRI